MTLCIALIPMNYIVVGEAWGHGPDNVLEDPIDGLIQIYNNSKKILTHFCWKNSGVVHKKKLLHNNI